MNNLPSTQLMALFQQMLFIRMVEERIADEYPKGKMRCPTHLSIGQESVPAVLSLFLGSNDEAVSTHRSHAHYLAKGGCLDRMIAELYGKETGCSGGRGGSMHLIDLEAGFKGSTAIVGNTIPLGVGMALAKQIKKEPGLVVVYLGDAATEEGVFYESASFAALKKLPVLFVCENNRYSVYSSLQVRQPQERKIYQLAAAIGLASWSGDGYAIEDSYQVIEQAVRHVRSGEGAAFVELATYRWREHCGPNFDNDIGYRTEQEYQQWRDKDPLIQLEQQLLTADAQHKELIEIVRENYHREIDQAFEKAQQANYPVYVPGAAGVFAS